MIKILIPAQLTGYRPKADKSFSLTFNTMELKPEEKVVVDQLFQQEGFLSFKDSAFTSDETDLFDSLDIDLTDNRKTPSQRLRNVLYRNWEQDNLGHTVFKDYYSYQMEKLITGFKNKLD
jgi:hypothetical protein